MSGVFPVNPVLMVDDDEAWLKSLSVLLKRKLGITNLVSCSKPKSVMSILASRAISIVLLDFSMPGMMGDQVLSNIKSEYPDIPVILLTGSDQVDVAVRCMQRGAFDYFVKTNDVDRILSGIQKAIRLHEMMHENRLLSSGFLNDAGPQHGEAFAGLWTRSFRMLRIFRYLEAIASSSFPVIISGEKGTGKVTLSKALHSAGKRPGAFVRCNVSEHGDFLTEVLCGRRHDGLLDQAEGGTLYLEGIEHLTRSGEEFLADLIDSPQYASEAGGKTKWFTGRIVASTDVPFDAISGMKRLLLKFDTHSVQLPSLRERREDLPVLVDCFLDEASQFFNKTRPTPPPELISLLGTYDFPGNIYELRQMIFNAVDVHAGRVLPLDLFKGEIFSTRVSSFDVPLVQFVGPRLPSLAEVRDILLKEAHRRAGGNQGVIADMLGITRTAISKWLNKGAESD